MKKITHTFATKIKKCELLLLILHCKSAYKMFDILFRQMYNSEIVHAYCICFTIVHCMFYSKKKMGKLIPCIIHHALIYGKVC